MSHYNFPPAVDELVRKQIATGAYQSEDDVLLAAMQSLDAAESDWQAVKVALDSLDASEQGLSLQEAFDAVRRRQAIAAIG
ncbi:hypothetical protein [Calycomorphotria hydatis]|uniref:Antitoxin ParD4 n=1 Tax=Calycomorphotria hydatis TaxID=2528027 RepID=A0A517TF57_9PLAN|nr:hypothetical protein [Calycomorphotria hydatis]QDT67005.1 hypothetical protein V22_42770 [Calycomorphotria hydatis]